MGSTHTAAGTLATENAVNNRFSELFVRRPVATILYLRSESCSAGCSAIRNCRFRRCRRSTFQSSRFRRICRARAPTPMATSVLAAARAALGPDRRRQRDDVAEHARLRPASPSSSGLIATSMARRARRPGDHRRRGTQVDLPTSLRREDPTYHEVNPADAPIMVIAMSSTTSHRGAAL